MEIKNLCKAYGDLPVLENVSFTAGVGVTALWGPSGVGKTTLLRILLGLEKPDSGELMGTAVRWSAVFQEDRLLEGLDALGNLRFALGTDYEEAKAEAMLPVCAGDGLQGSESGGHARGAGPDLGDGQAGGGVVRRHEAPLGFGPGVAGSIRRRGAGRAVHRAG